jgi:pilus assembly protein TadC
VLFSKKYEETLKKAQIDSKKFQKTVIIFSLVFSVLLSGFFALILYRLNVNPAIALLIFPVLLISFYVLIKLIPTFKVKNNKAFLESDLLYSARHLLLKIESGSSLINSLESVANLKTKSSSYFKEIMYDISLGIPIEEAIDKAVVYSPSKAYTKILEEIQSSLSTGSDLRKSLRATVDDVTKEHLIQIQEYGRKLNPMSMFYMIIGTILPSMGTAMLVVISSLRLIEIIIDIRILMSFAILLLCVQIFFILSFRSLKPAVMD